MAELIAWFVLFPASNPATEWWQRLLRPGYRHCLVLREDGQGRTLVIDHGGAQMRVHSVPVPVGEMLRDLQRETTAWVLMVTLPPGVGRPPWRPIMTCVETVKAALGIHAPFVLTPAALARHLRRHHQARAVLPQPA